ncbi:hypothetical protein [Streptomyces sp. NPDC056670]|uniref:hypothetical protein n=1 Tax=Streptomyces sp. NPDC056670 TaxID=3345904 RepID=UPI003678AB7B
MAESRLQRLLQERKDKEELARIVHALPDHLPGQGVPREQVPPWLTNAVREFWHTSTEPSSVLSVDADPARLEQWAEELLALHGISEQFYVLSDVDGLPWLTFRASGPGWFSLVREVIESDWVFASHSLDVVAAVSEQEHVYEFFVKNDREARPNRRDATRP